MRKMKKINGYLVVKFNARELREYEGTALGEYGVIDKAPLESTLNWYRDIHAAFEKFGIGRAAWSYKKMSFGLIDDHYREIYDELITLL